MKYIFSLICIGGNALNISQS